MDYPCAMRRLVHAVYVTAGPLPFVTLLPVVCCLVLLWLSQPVAASDLAAVGSPVPPATPTPMATASPTPPPIPPPATPTATRRCPTATATVVAAAPAAWSVWVPHAAWSGLASAAATATPEPPTPTPVPPTPTPTPTALPTPDGVPREAVVPILMYHHVAEQRPEWDRIRRNLSVSPATLRRHLEYLRLNGYQAVTVADLVRHLAVGVPLPERPVILTFDDGYRDNYELAFPLLQEFGFVASFYPVTAPIDQGSPEFMTWAQVREMHEAGMEFGSHSYTHPDLRRQGEDYLIWQVLGSREAIEERIGEPVRVFAYPSGAYDGQVVETVQALGFWAALTADQGCRHRSDGLLTLARIRVQPYDSEATLADKLIRCAE